VAQQYTQQQLAQIIGRNQGPEFFFQQAVTLLTSPILSKNLNLTRPLNALHMILRMRVVIAGHDYDSVAAEAPQNFLQRLRITGTHAKFGSLVPVDMSGASIFSLTRLTRNYASSLYINGTRQPDPSTPFQQVGPTFGNIGTYDIECHYFLPVIPILSVAVKNSGVPYMWQPSDWSDTIQLQPFFGDATSFGVPDAATTVAFSSFGSGTGSPQLFFFTNYEILGPLANQISAAVVIRSSQFITNQLSAVSSTPTQLINLQKQKTTNIFIKTGTLVVPTSGGVTVFATLADNILEQTQPIVDNKPIRNNFLNSAMKEYIAKAFDTVTMQGYLAFSFVDSQNPLTFYRGDLVPAGSTFAVNSQILNSPSNVAAEIIQEQVYGNPRAGVASSATAGSSGASGAAAASS